MAASELPTAGTPSLRETDRTVQRRVEFIREELSGSSPGLVLDAGCGLGAYLPFLMRESSRVIGADFNLHNLRKAFVRNRLSQPETRAHLAGASIEKTPVRSEVFDVIICIETLEHVADDGAVVKEFRRLIKPGGRLILSVPYKWFPLETHAVRFGSRLVSSPFGLGTPLLPFFPNKIRALFATARLYTLAGLRKTLESNCFRPMRSQFLMPSLDVLERKTLSIAGAQALVRLTRRGLSILEVLHSRRWGSTIILSAEAI